MVNAAANRLYYSVFQAVRYSDAMKPLRKRIPTDNSPKHHAAEQAVGSRGKDARNAKRHFAKLLSLRETASIVSTRNRRQDHGSWRSEATPQAQAADAAANEEYAKAA